MAARQAFALPRTIFAFVFGGIRKLRAGESEGGPRAVVVALTTYAGEQDRRRVLDAGFDAHVAKPFDPEVLARTIRSLLPHAGH